MPLCAGNEFDKLLDLLNVAIAHPIQVPSRAEHRDVTDAKRLACAILRQSLMDLGQSLDRHAGLRGDRQNAFTDVAEVLDWLMNDTYFVTVDVEPMVPVEHAEVFPAHCSRHTINLEREADGTYGFASCCTLAGLRPEHVRQIVRSWMTTRSPGDSFVLSEKAVAGNRRKSAHVRQKKLWEAAGYPLMQTNRLIPKSGRAGNGTVSTTADIP
jgi:hypothetical protein